VIPKYPSHFFCFTISYLLNCHPNYQNCSYDQKKIDVFGKIVVELFKSTIFFNKKIFCGMNKISIIAALGIMFNIKR